MATDDFMPASWLTLDRILPTTRQSLIEKYALMIIALKDKVKSTVDDACMPELRGR